MYTFCNSSNRPFFPPRLSPIKHSKCSYAAWICWPLSKLQDRTQRQTVKELYRCWVFTLKWWKFSSLNYFNLHILERHWLKFSLLRPRHASKVQLLWNDPEESIFCLIAFFNVYIFFYLSCLFAEFIFFLLDANKKLFQLV